MKIIAQVLVYEEGEYLRQAVEPWISVCEQIDIFEGAFQTTTNLGYPPRSQDKTIEIAVDLMDKHENVVMNHHNEWNEPILRNNHLFTTIQYFGREDTVLFILDGDEVYSSEDVQKCVKQVSEELDRYNTFWIGMRNFISDEKTYYNGFRVPRFFKLKNAVGFSGYNDVAFTDGVKPTDIRDVLPNHYSWCPINKAARKIAWQEKALGWQCSFKIENNQVVVNNAYYQQTGKERPKFYQL